MSSYAHHSNVSESYVHKESTETSVLPDLLSHLHRHFAEHIILDDLCRLSQRSRFQIIRAFRRGLGLTPHAYILTLRIRRAVAMLAEGAAAADVAAEAGFADQSHLARHFKRHFGETPASFQRRFRPAH